MYIGPSDLQVTNFYKPEPIFTGQDLLTWARLKLKTEIRQLSNSITEIFNWIRELSNWIRELSNSKSSLIELENSPIE